MSPIPGSRWYNNINNINALLQARNNHVLNIGLLLGKYIEWTNLSASGPLNINKQMNLTNAIRCNPPLDQANYLRLKNRKNSIPGPRLIFVLRSQSRVSINLGDESILETNINLHPLFGFPVLPGSAIKGVTRHYLEENQLTDNARIEELFGDSPGKEGDIVFLEAWPQQYGRYLELAIMNSHFPDYYQGRAWPADNQNPIPIPFLVVKAETSFEFALSLAAKGRKRPGLNANETLNAVGQWVKLALAEYGLGAKTGSGYGYFG